MPCYTSHFTHTHTHTHTHTYTRARARTSHVLKYSFRRQVHTRIVLYGTPRHSSAQNTHLSADNCTNLWRFIAIEAKKHCTMILTTHSMDEAQALCDRLGIFVDGQLRCVGTSSSLRSRFGNHMVSPAFSAWCVPVQFAHRYHKFSHIRGMPKLYPCVYVRVCVCASVCMCMCVYVCVHKFSFVCVSLCECG
jgi:hypothetical protein